jgi:hypothetical protein
VKKAAEVPWNVLFMIAALFKRFRSRHEGLTDRKKLGMGRAPGSPRTAVCEPDRRQR